MTATKRSRLIRTLMLVSAAVGVLLCISLTLAFNTDFDAEITHFARNSPWAGAATVLSAVLAVLGGVAWILAGKDHSFKETDREKTPFVPVFFGALSGLCTALAAYFQLKAGFPDDKRIFFVLRFVFTVIAAVWFFADAVGILEFYPAASITALLPALMIAFTILCEYFSSELAMNSPVKTYGLLMFVSFMLFFKDTAGHGIKRPGASRNLVFSGILSAFFGGAVAISRTVTYFSNPDDIGINITECAIAATVWIYAVASFLRIFPFGEKSKEASDTSASAGEANSLFDDSDEDDDIKL